MSITINHIDPTDKTALHCHYPRQAAQQPCELRIDLQNGILSVGYNPEIGQPRAIPMSVWNRRTIVFEIPCLTTSTANRLLDEAGPIAQRMVDGATIEWDGNNRVGMLNGDAQDAQEELAELIAIYQDDDVLATGDVESWFVDGQEAALRWEELGADSTYDDILAASEKVVAEAIEQNIVIDSDDVVKYLQEAREEARGELREELEMISEELAEVKARRDELITQQVGWGDSGRDVGERAGISHVAVQKIARRNTLER